MDFDPKAKELLEDLNYKTSLIEPYLTTSVQRLKHSPLLFNTVNYAMSSGGKRIRPALVLISADLCGGEEDQVLPAAMAYEFLHNFALVHDDVMERNQLRRGKPTVRSKFGDSSALIAGDVMFSMAYEELHKLSKEFHPSKVLTAFNYFNQTCNSLAVGQLREVELQEQANIRVKDYYEVVDNRTSALIIGPLKTGALLSNAGDEELEALEQYGIAFGRIFQIREDLLDLEPLSLDRERAHNVKTGKRTLIAVHALNNLPARDKQDLIEILNKPARDTTEKDVNKAMALFIKAGSIDYARQQLLVFSRQAVEALEHFGDTKPRILLQSMTEFAATRTH